MKILDVKFFNCFYCRWFLVWFLLRDKFSISLYTYAEKWLLSNFYSYHRVQWSLKYRCRYSSALSHETYYGDELSLIISTYQHLNLITSSSIVPFTGMTNGNRTLFAPRRFILPSFASFAYKGSYRYAFLRYIIFPPPTFAIWPFRNSNKNLSRI